MRAKRRGRAVDLHHVVAGHNHIANDSDGLADIQGRLDERLIVFVRRVEVVRAHAPGQCLGAKRPRNAGIDVILKHVPDAEDVVPLALPEHLSCRIGVCRIAVVLTSQIG